MITLKGLILDKIKALDISGAASHYGVSEATVKRWIDDKKPGNPSFDVAEIVFAEYVDSIKDVALKEPIAPAVKTIKQDDDDLGLSTVDDDALEKRLAEIAKGSQIKLRPGERIVTDPTDDGYGDAPSTGTQTPSSMSASTIGVIGANPFSAKGSTEMTEDEWKAAMKTVKDTVASVPSATPSTKSAAIASGGKRRDTMILFPCERNIQSSVAVNIMCLLRDQDRHRFEHVSMHFLPDARNHLVKRFLASDCEWSFWADSDMIFPAGPRWANWFLSRTGAKNIPQQFASLHTIDQLKSRGHKMIGGVYSPRQLNRKALIASGSPVSQGPVDRVEPVKWLATGCLLVHRSVYESMGKDGWFDLDRTLTSGGEDVAFSLRATKAGYQPMLDMSIFCGHVGAFVYLPEHCNNNATHTI